jgi:hypothetical protein
MANIDYKKNCNELLGLLAPKQREVIERRFGLKTGKRETLEAIGKSYHICRERVRQVEKAAMVKMKKKIGGYKDVSQFFGRYLKNFGGVREENILLEETGGAEFRMHANFLLVLGGEFIRFAENDNYKSFWAADSASAENAKNFVLAATDFLKEKKELASVRELASLSGIKKGIAESYLGISSQVQKNKDGLYGLREWPEVNPKGIKDKIYLLFKKSRDPLHFTEVAKKINGSLVQTVHNELIRDKRFVLVGRGLYALKEWGYVEGDVKAVILDIFNSENRPLTRNEILEKVLKQRHIKENTVLMNLSNRKYFTRDDQGRYSRADVREA